MPPNFFTQPDRIWLKTGANNDRIENHTGLGAAAIFLANIWTAPPPAFVKLNTDGSVSNSIATAGGLIHDREGNWIAGFSMNIGTATVAESELWGLRQGIFLALQLNHKQIQVESDSLEVIDALNRSHPSQNQGPALLVDCWVLLRKFVSPSLHHAPRELNRAADHLAKLGYNL